MLDVNRLAAALADRYRLERELGAGGMATVYLANDLRHDRKVALKVLRPELAAVIGAERFLAEIKTTAALQHPHILPLFDSGQADGFLFYVMPLIEGESLRDRLNREHQLPVEDAVQLAKEIGLALDYAHRHGVIHRDIKPENILLHDGAALVADFGIALAVSHAGGNRMTETGPLPRHAGLHEPGAGHRRARPRCPRRCLQPRLPALRDARRRAAAHRAHRAGGDRRRGDQGARAAQPAPALGAGATSRPPCTRRSPSSRPIASPPRTPSSRRSASRGRRPRWRRSPPSPPRRAAPDKRRTMVVAGGDAAPCRARRVGLAAPAAASLHEPLRRSSCETTRRSPRPRSAATSRSPPTGAASSTWDAAKGRRASGSRMPTRSSPTVLAGTEGALSPFFSPDGRQLGFVKDGKTVRILPLEGGSPLTLTDSANATAADWGSDGYVYFEVDSGISRIRATGGRSEQVYKFPATERCARRRMAGGPPRRARGALPGAPRRAGCRRLRDYGAAAAEGRGARTPPRPLRALRRHRPPCGRHRRWQAARGPLRPRQARALRAAGGALRRARAESLRGGGGAFPRPAP